MAPFFLDSARLCTLIANILQCRCIRYTVLLYTLCRLAVYVMQRHCIRMSGSLQSFYQTITS